MRVILFFSLYFIDATNNLSNGSGNQLEVMSANPVCKRYLLQFFFQIKYFFFHHIK